MGIRKVRNFFLDGMKEFGENISVLVNSLLLTFVYFIGIGLTSLLKRDALDVSLNKDTYWKNLSLTKRAKEEYYRMF